MPSGTGTTRQRHIDYCITRLQERGYCRVATLSVAEIMTIVELAGLYADECFIDVSGWLYTREAMKETARRA